MTGRSGFPLDILAQQPGINRLYTPLTLCFPLPVDSGAVQGNIVQGIRSGLDRLAVAFPWVAGKVAQTDGRFVIVSAGGSIPLRIKSLGGVEWRYSWQDLQQARFPFAMLHEDDVASHATLANDEELTDGLPVLMVQINFIPAGLLLTVQGQHGAMDMAGLVQVMRLLSKACRGLEFLPDELRIGNLQRDATIPLLTDEEYQARERLAQQEDQRRHPLDSSEPPKPSAPLAPTKNLQWAYFNFSSSSLARLKALASESVAEGSYISTNDALSTLIWSAITRVRDHHHSDSSTTLSRNVDLRHILGAPATYPGFLVRSADYTCSKTTLLNAPPGVTAEKLRASLDPVALKRGAEFAAKQASRGSAVTSHGAKNPALDVRLSSWAKERCSDLDFGFGAPEAVRRPAFTVGAREGLVYFLPKTRTGDIVVGVCLDQSDVRALRDEEYMCPWAEYIG